MFHVQLPPRLGENVVDVVFTAGILALPRPRRAEPTLPAALIEPGHRGALETPRDLVARRVGQEGAEEIVCRHFATLDDAAVFFGAALFVRLAVPWRVLSPPFLKTLGNIVFRRR